MHAQTVEETEEQALERNRELDRDERDALVERMMEKDKSKTKKAELGGLTPAQARLTCLVLYTRVNYIPSSSHTGQIRSAFMFYGIQGKYVPGLYDLHGR